MEHTTYVVFSQTPHPAPLCMHVPGGVCRLCRLGPRAVSAHCQWSPLPPHMKALSAAYGVVWLCSRICHYRGGGSNGQPPPYPHCTGAGVRCCGDATLYPASVPAPQTMQRTFDKFHSAPKKPFSCLLVETGTLTKDHNRAVLRIYANQTTHTL